MPKFGITKLLALCILSCLGCQEESTRAVSHSDLIAVIKDNAGKPFSCTIRRISQMDFANKGNLAEAETRSSFVYESENTSTLLSHVSVYPMPTITLFYQWSNGFKHSVRELSPGDWECDLREQLKYPLGNVGLFPSGGLNLFAQVQEMLEELGPTRTTYGSLAKLSWTEFPESVRADMLSQYGIYEGSTPGPIEVHLSLNSTLGLPVEIEVKFGKGESVVTHFSDFEFPKEPNSDVADKLRRKAKIPNSFVCVCDLEGAILNTKDGRAVAGE